MPPRAKIPQWSNAQSYAISEVVEWQNALWVATQATPANVSPDGVVVNWRRITSTSVTPRFASYDSAYSYQIDDHVYYGNALYEAVQPSTGSTPVWPTDTADWKYVGNINRFAQDPAKHDTSNGSVVTYNGGAEYELRQPAARGGSAGFRANGLEQYANLSSKPTKSLSFIGSSILKGLNTKYSVPTLIAAKSGGFIDILDGGKLIYYQAINFGAFAVPQHGYTREKNLDSNAWGSSTAGMPLVHKAQNIPKSDDSINYNLKFNKLDDQFWLLHVDLRTRVWGNDNGYSNAVFEIKADIMENLTAIGIKHLLTSVNNDLYGAIEWT